MDYVLKNQANTSHRLYKYQWDYIHDPETMLFASWEDEEEGEVFDNGNLTEDEIVEVKNIIQNYTSKSKIFKMMFYNLDKTYHIFKYYKIEDGIMGISDYEKLESKREIKIVIPKQYFKGGILNNYFASALGEEIIHIKQAFFYGLKEDATANDFVNKDIVTIETEVRLIRLYSGIINDDEFKLLTGQIKKYNTGLDPATIVNYFQALRTQNTKEIKNLETKFREQVKKIPAILMNTEIYPVPYPFDNEDLKNFKGLSPYFDKLTKICKYEN
jgi:hypothetical protein